MKWSIKVYGLLFLIAVNRSDAQNTTKLQALKIGDVVPAITIHNIHNYKKPAATLAELGNGKPLIIDFWDTHCNSCLKSLPSIDSLYRKFNENFNVLSVTSEDSTAVRHLFNSLPSLQNIRLPYITNDKLFASFFPHRYVPHIVWINSKGRVVAYTSENEVSADGIQSFIENDSVHLFTKEDDMQFDIRNPYHPADSLILYKSSFSHFNPSVISNFYTKAGRDTAFNITDSVTRICIINGKPVNMLYEAFSELTGVQYFTSPQYFRIIFNIHDSANYYFPVADSIPKNITWKMNNLFCYEQITPPESKTVFFSYMLNNLNMYLPIQGKIEKKQMPCYVIRNILNHNDLIKSAGGLPVYSDWGGNKDSVTVILKNSPFSAFVALLNQFELNLPVYDETNFTEPVDMKIALNIKDSHWLIKYDVNTLKKALHAYGLELTETGKLMDVLVISDRN